MAIVDVWSLVHLGVFAVAAHMLPWDDLPRLKIILLLALGATVGWELFESWSGFLQGDHGGEHWVNRWVSDPICNLLGTLTGYYAIPKWCRNESK